MRAKSTFPPRVIPWNNSKTTQAAHTERPAAGYSEENALLVFSTVSLEALAIIALLACLWGEYWPYSLSSCMKVKYTCFIMGTYSTGITWEING